MFKNVSKTTGLVHIVLLLGTDGIAKSPCRCIVARKVREIIGEPWGCFPCLFRGGRSCHYYSLLLKIGRNCVSSATLTMLISIYGFSQ